MIGAHLNKGRMRVRIVTGWVTRARAVWVKYHGLIPNGFIVHHRDEDGLHDAISNLELKSRGLHTSHHMKGRVKSLEHRQNLSLAKKGILTPKMVAHLAILNSGPKLRNERGRFRSK